MSLETYKMLNEELIQQVQELKRVVTSLELELVKEKRNTFNEYEKRIIMENKCRRFVNKLKKTMNQACEFGNELFPATSPDRPRNFTVTMRRSSTAGVTVRSPLRLSSPQQPIVGSEPPITEEATNTSNENGAAHNLFGLSNLDERSEQSEQSENVVPTSSMRTENTNQSVSCQSVDMTDDSGTIISPKSVNVPTVFINNRRRTQDWSHDILRAQQGTVTAAASAVVSPNSLTASTGTTIHSPNNLLTATSTITNLNNHSNSNSLDRLTVDFSENLCLHSTPRTCEVTSLANHTDQSQNLTQSSRPRRKCAPKVLTEPSLGCKLRNENPKPKPKKKKK